VQCVASSSPDRGRLNSFAKGGGVGAAAFGLLLTGTIFANRFVPTKLTSKAVAFLTTPSSGAATFAALTLGGGAFAVWSRPRQSDEVASSASKEHSLSSDDKGKRKTGKVEEEPEPIDPRRVWTEEERSEIEALGRALKESNDLCLVVVRARDYLNCRILNDYIEKHSADDLPDLARWQIEQAALQYARGECECDADALQAILPDLLEQQEFAVFRQGEIDRDQLIYRGLTEAGVEKLREITLPPLPAPHQ